MATRYEGESGELDLFMIDSIPRDNKTNAPVHGRLSVLLQWHSEDPVDDWERNRNEVIYSYQRNRNPLIDKPEFVDLIWGDDIDLKEYVITKSAELMKVVDVLGR